MLRIPMLLERLFKPLCFDVAFAAKTRAERIYKDHEQVFPPNKVARSFLAFRAIAGQSQSVAESAVNLTMLSMLVTRSSANSLLPSSIALNSIGS